MKLSKSTQISRKTGRQKTSKFQIRLISGIVFVASWLCFFSASIQEAAGKPAEDPLRRQTFEINIHNDTEERIQFHVRILHSGEEPEFFYLAPGDMQTLMEREVIEFQIVPEDLSRLYFLAPGEDYSIRMIDGKDLKVFQKVKGYDMAVMLAPFVPSPMVVIERVLTLAGVNKNSIVYDLGCGDGRVVIAAARIYGAKGVGIDIDPDLIAEARRNALAAGVEELVEFKAADIFQSNLTEATLVYIFLFPDSNRLLRPYLEKQLKRGTKVACLGFNLPAWEDRLTGQHDIVDDEGYHRIVYMYER